MQNYSGLFFIFFFLDQPIRNKIPIMNGGPAICIDQANIYHSNEFLSNTTIYNSPARIKAIPPTISYFHEINRTANNINAGTLCINNPTTVCQKLKFSAKTSNENSIKNKMNIIAKILGAQYTDILVFFFILIPPSFFESLRITRL